MELEHAVSLEKVMTVKRVARVFRDLTPQQQQQPFNGLFSRTTWVSRYQKGKTDLDFTGARDSEWQ